MDYEKLHEEHKKLDYKRVEMTEHDFERRKLERKRMQKKAKMYGEKMMNRKKMNVEPDSYDEMIETVDTLLSSLISPTEIFQPEKTSPAAVSQQFPSPTTTETIEIPEPDTYETEYFSFPTTDIIEIAELDACETAITIPSVSTTKSGQPKVSDTTKPTTTTHPLQPFNPTIDTPLHSHPPSTPERIFALNLSAAHHARITTAEAIRSQKQNASLAFDAGKVGNRPKLTFGQAVVKGFRGVFGEEGCW